MPCPEAAAAGAQSAAWPPITLSQDAPTKEPPFVAGPLQMRWDYSDLVCTGLADQPQRTGKVGVLGGYDRDQLSANAFLQTCFKGNAPQRQIRVLGDSVFAQEEVQGRGMVYSGPSPGFVVQGRNLFFLRKTNSPAVWRVTLPAHECALPLADIPPDYRLDSSEASIRAALGAEIMAVIRQGYVRAESYSYMTVLNQPEAVVGTYAAPLFDILGRTRALDALATLLNDPRLAMRRAVAVELMINGDQRGLAGTLAALRDKDAPDYVRTNAARALEYTDSPRAQAALEVLAREPINDVLHHVARDIVERRLRRSQ